MKVNFVPYGKLFLFATLVVGIFVGLVCGCFLYSFIDKQKKIQCSSNLRACWLIMNDSAESLNTSFPITNSFVLHQVLEIAKHRIHMQQIACPSGGRYWVDPISASVKCTYHHGERIGVVDWPLERVFLSSGGSGSPVKEGDQGDSETTIKKQDFE